MQINGVVFSVVGAQLRLDRPWRIRSDRRRRLGVRAVSAQRSGGGVVSPPRSRPARRACIVPAASSQSFAGGEYLHALDAGDTLDASTSATRSSQTAPATSAFPRRIIRNAQMRIPYYAFEKELLRDQDIVLGRYDARYALYDVRSHGRLPQLRSLGRWHEQCRRFDVEPVRARTTALQHEPAVSPYVVRPLLGARWDMHHNGQDPPANVVPDLAQRDVAESAPAGVFSRTATTTSRRRTSRRTTRSSIWTSRPRWKRISSSILSVGTHGLSQPDGPRGVQVRSGPLVRQSNVDPVVLLGTNKERGPNGPRSFIRSSW